MKVIKPVPSNLNDKKATPEDVNKILERLFPTSSTIKDKVNINEPGQATKAEIDAVLNRIF